MLDDAAGILLFLPSFTAQGAIGFHDSSSPNVMMRGVHTRKDFERQCRVLRWRQVPLVKDTYDSAVLSGARSFRQGTYCA